MDIEKNWDELIDKSWERVNDDWGDMSSETLEITKLLNVKPVQKTIKKKIPAKIKHDYSSPIKWLHTVDLSILKSSPLIKETKTHTPIPHDKVLTEFRNAITFKQMIRIAENGLLSEDKSKYFYITDVLLRTNKDKPNSKDYITNTGFVNFNCKQLWGCSPLQGMTMYKSRLNTPLVFYTRQGFTYNAKIKHTKYSVQNIHPRCRNMLKEYSAMKHKQRRYITLMKKIKFSDKYLGYIVLNLIRKLACGRELLSVKSVENLITTWGSGFYPNTLWGFHHAFTETFQQWSNPIRRLQIYDYYYLLLLEIIKKKNKVI